MLIYKKLQSLAALRLVLMSQLCQNLSSLVFVLQLLPHFCKMSAPDLDVASLCSDIQGKEAVLLLFSFL